jgi:hypothetical protein
MTLAELKAKYPNGSDEFFRRNADYFGLCPVQSKPTEGGPLVSSVQRKKAGGTRVAGRAESTRRCRITFRIYSVRPLDWDNYSVKQIQDCLVHAGLLGDDKWDILEGGVVSEKAHSKEEERTEITIEYDYRRST